MCEGSGDEDDMWLLVVVSKDVDEGSHRRGLGFAGILVVLARRRSEAVFHGESLKVWCEGIRPWVLMEDYLVKVVWWGWRFWTAVSEEGGSCWWQ